MGNFISRFGKISDLIDIFTLQTPRNMNISDDTSVFPIIDGLQGRPAHYPIVDDYDNLLFYIQRNQNLSTVVYEVNLQYADLLNISQPILMHWLQFDQFGMTEKKELNYIQKKMAYGYTFNIISSDLLEFRFVSYDKMKFYLGKDSNGRFKVFSKMDGHMIEINSMFVYSEDYGVFPQVKFVEFYGKNTDSGDTFYKKLNLE